MEGFQINYTDIYDLFWEYKINLENLMDNIDTCMNNINSFIENAVFTGKTGEAVKFYLADAHITMLSSLKVVSQNLLDNMVRYKYGYSEIDNSTNFQLSEEAIRAFRTNLNTNYSDTDVYTRKIQGAVSDISDISNSSIPSTNGVLELHERIDQELLDLIKAVEDYESETVSELEKSVEVLLDDFEACITKIGLDKDEIANYQKDIFYKDVDVCGLIDITQQLYKLHEGKKIEYDSMYHFEQKLKDSVDNCDVKATFKEISDKAIDGIKAFIPQRINNETVLDALHILRNIDVISNSVIKKNEISNINELQKNGYIPPKGAYIENQALWGNVKFGDSYNSNMSYSGCEIIATYNALIALETSPSKDVMVELISEYERSGAVLKGEFGVDPMAIDEYFLKKGYIVDMTDSTDMNVINQLGNESDVVIVTVYNDKNDISQMIHTVCITKTEDGKYIAHNIYKKENNVYVPSGKKSTLEEAIQCIGCDPAIISTIGIKCSTS